jgi:hypothetical protein
MAIRLHVEGERTIPLSVSGVDSVELKHSEAFINAISPTARVDQTEDGAIITVTDKNGTTTAELTNGQIGPQGPKGDTGEQGARGEKGDKGDKGDTPEITLENVSFLLPTDTASGSVASFPDGADDIPLKSLVVGIDPVQDLHGYSNPWPAGGGKNVFDAKTWATLLNNDRYYSVGADESITVIAGDLGGITGRFIDVSPNEEYSILSTFTSNVKVFNSGSNIILHDKFGTFTAPADGKIAIKFYASTYPTTGYFILTKGSTVPSAWSPYSNICPISGWTGMTVNANGTEIPISWESEAGTVYGGTLDVLTGVLTVDRAMITADELYSYGSGNLTYGSVVLPNALPTASVSTNYVTSKFPVDKSAAENTTRRVSGYACFYFPAGTTREYAESVVNGTQIVYPVADPITYQLTPHEVKSLLGQNNIWSGTGDTAVTYRADIQRYIQKMLSQ